jgi:predicted permease
MTTINRETVRRFLPSFVVNAALPFVAYSLLRNQISDFAALAAACAVPVVATAVAFIVRRRLDPIGVVAAIGFLVALMVVVLSGGNEIVLKLQEAVVTGLLCLASVAVGRPLHAVVLKLAARRNPRLALNHRHRTSMIVTTVVGATLVVHALALLVLAITEPTGTYLALARPVGLPIIAAGLGWVAWYRHRLRRAVNQPGS